MGPPFANQPIVLRLHDSGVSPSQTPNVFVARGKKIKVEIPRYSAYLDHTLKININTVCIYIQAKLGTSPMQV